MKDEDKKDFCSVKCKCGAEGELKPCPFAYEINDNKDLCPCCKDCRHECVDCEEEIPVKRQAAIPGVRLCFDCQSSADRKLMIGEKA